MVERKRPPAAGERHGSNRGPAGDHPDAVCAVLYLGVWFLMYQNWAVQYVATDTASRIAQTYGYSSSDPITGYISHATRVSLSPYRYKDDEEEKIQDVNANRAEKYARYSLKKQDLQKKKDWI